MIKRNFPAATPEMHTNPSLTMVVRTRSPMEAYEMLRAGQPIDQAVGYYIETGQLDKDLFMMDHVEKLHALAKFRELKAHAQQDYNDLSAQMQADHLAARAVKQQVTNQIPNNEQKQEVNGPVS